MHILVERIADPASSIAFRWSVTMRAPDADGARRLHYRATGVFVGDLNRLQFESEPQVHDEKRPVWTTMNLTDRPDIRKMLVDRATKGLKKLQATGKDKFEYIVP